MRVACLSALLLAAAAASAAPKPDPERLVGRLAPGYSHAASFVPALLRYPLTQDPEETYRLARAAATENPADLAAQRAAALAAEAAEKDVEAAEHWRVVLGLVEARQRAAKDRKDPALLEQQVEALVGADAAVRAVPAAEALLKARPGDWRAHLLAGDAHLRRADLNWRVLVRRSQGSPSLPPQPLLQLNSDLDAAKKAYDAAVDLAPAEGAPRGARIALAVARPLMASFLPAGVVRAEARPDFQAVRADLLDWVAKSRPRVVPVWFTALFFVTQVGQEMTPAERSALEAALSNPGGGDEGLFALEARGMLALSRADWTAGRKAFEEALGREARREFSRDWLAVAEANTPEPRDVVLARVRARAGEGGTAQDWTLVGMLLGEDERSRAVEALRKAVNLGVDNANARHNLALLLLRQNPASQEARHHLRRALENRPDDRDARLAYAVTLVLDGHHKEARATLDALLKQHELDAKLKARILATREDIPAPPLPNEIGAGS